MKLAFSRSFQSRLLIIGACVAGMLTAIGFLFYQSTIFTGYSTAGSYPAYTLDERIQLSDAIFAGNVLSISPTQFNQDSGQYWTPEETDVLAYSYHLIEIGVARSLKDTLGLEQAVTLLQVGMSPQGNRADLTITDRGEPEHSLQVGDRAVFFIQEMEFPWRETGRVPALQFFGVPEHSYMRLTADGQLRSNEEPGNVLSLDQLQEKVQALLGGSP